MNSRISIAVLFLLLAASAASAQIAPKVYMTKQVTKSQGFDIHQGKAVVVSDGGTVNIYDFDKANSVPIATFPLGSARAGNHSNTANFGIDKPSGAAFPLLYVSVGKPGDIEEWCCNVEKISEANGTYSSQRVQKIVLDQSDFKTLGFIPIWGCPNWVVDKENKALWAFSAVKRTTVAATGPMESNTYLALKFRIPKLSEGEVVTLRASDVLAEVTFPFDTYITQGGTMRDGKIYYAFGYGKTGTQTPARLRIYDTVRGTFSGIELEQYMTEEPEDVSIYKGRIYVNTNSAKLYELQHP